MKEASLEAANDHDLRFREAEAHLEKDFVDLSEEPAAPAEETNRAVQGPDRHAAAIERQTAFLTQMQAATP